MAAKAFKEETGISPSYKFDVSDFDQVKGAVAEIEKELGPIEIVVNNAGITRDSTMRRLDRTMWQAVIDTNLGFLLQRQQGVWDGMNTRGFGRIVNIGSINGQGWPVRPGELRRRQVGHPRLSLRRWPRKGASKGITVNAIAPGYTDTDMVSAVPAPVLEKIVAKIPVGRLGKADEIARGVLFLVADDAGFITGSTLSINGGSTCTDQGGQKRGGAMAKLIEYKDMAPRAKAVRRRHRRGPRHGSGRHQQRLESARPPSGGNGAVRGRDEGCLRGRASSIRSPRNYFISR